MATKYMVCYFQLVKLSKFCTICFIFCLLLYWSTYLTFVLKKVRRVGHYTSGVVIDKTNDVGYVNRTKMKSSTTHSYVITQKMCWKTNFRPHSSIIECFFQKTLSYKMLGNQVEFYLQKFIWGLKTPPKIYGQILERVFENVQKNDPSNPSLKFVHNF